MIENEFRRPVSVDTAPRGSRCEWCGKPAEVQLTAIGGIAHNESGLFCNSCGQEFTPAFTNAACTTTSTDTTQQTLSGHIKSTAGTTYLVPLLSNTCLPRLMRNVPCAC